jgi:transcriptional regulator
LSSKDALKISWLPSGMIRQWRGAIAGAGHAAIHEGSLETEPPRVNPWVSRLSEPADPSGGYHILLLTSDIMKRDSKLDLLQGTLDLLILRTLQTGPLHGWAISERIQQISRDVLQVNQGSLYPALHRLEHQGWIKAESGISELGRRARFYRLTTSGRKQLELEVDDWEKLTVAIGRILKEA